MEEKNPCDVEDFVCQLGILSHLQGIEGIVGGERFKQDYPEFSGLSESVADRIKASETSLREAYKNCGLVDVETDKVLSEETINVDTE